MGDGGACRAESNLSSRSRGRRGLNPADHASLEVENGQRQYAHCLELIHYYLDPERPFALRETTISDLQRLAVEGIEPEPGRYRRQPAGITGSRHTPPPAFTIAEHIRHLCDYVNDNWHERNAFHLSAYVMWRLNWIHPFSDGNGRTSRTLSYILLCLKLGYQLPGILTIPQQIEMDKTHYINALEACDEASIDGLVDVGAMEAMLRDMLAKQLLGVIEAADGRFR